MVPTRLMTMPSALLVRHYFRALRSYIEEFHSPARNSY